MRAWLRVGLLGCTALLLAACGGGGGSTTSAVPGKAAASVSVTLVIPSARGTATASRSPRYVSPATSAVSIAVNGGTPQTFQVNTTQASCWPPQPNAVCSVFSIDAPVGTDIFVVTLFDASGNALSTVTTSATIVSGVANVFRFVANGVVAALAVSVSGSPPAPGTATNQRVDVVALDADGYTILGALPSILITETDSSGTTSLYLASDSTCTTPTSAPSGSVTISQSNGAYPTVCLNYTGGAMSSPATVTVSTPGVAAASTHFQATSSRGSGVWVFGSYGGAATLAKLDTSLTVTQTISGLATGLSSLSQVVGMDVDASQHVSLLNPQTGTAFTITTYDGTKWGNVAPLSVTAFTLALKQVNITGPALDRHGGAYVMGIGTNAAQTQLSCAIYYVPLNGGTSTATQAYDCTGDAFSGAGLEGIALHTAASGDLFAGFDTTDHAPTGALYRFRVTSSGLDAAGSASTGPVDEFGLYPNGNAGICRSLVPAAEYTIATTDQSFTATNAGQYTPNYCNSIAMDASGNAYLNASGGGAGVYFVPAGSLSSTTSTTAITGVLAGYVGP